MSLRYWQQVRGTGLAVPTDRPLDDLTAELTSMLGSIDPETRDGLALPTLATWLSRGVYDDLLRGLGDGMAAGLLVGLGEDGTDTVFRRSFSVLVLATCIERDNEERLLPADTILAWGDRIAAWYLREQDLRGYVPTKGWAHAIAHGADAIGQLAGSRHVGLNELVVLLDVLADRVLAPADRLLTSGEPDRIAQATLAVLRRDLVPLQVLEPWVGRFVAVAAHPPMDDSDPFLTTGNADAFVRALHLHLALASEPPAVRSDLLLVLTDALRAIHPYYFRKTRE